MGHVLTLANSIIGVGILAMPFCFQKCGIILSVLLLIMSNTVTRISCHLLMKSSVLTRRRSFEFLAFHAFGSSGKLMVELCVIGFLVGSCIAFFVVIGDLGPQITAKALNLAESDRLKIFVMLIVTILCIIPLGLLRNVDSLSTVCTASVGFYFCLVIKVIAESEKHIGDSDCITRIEYWKPSGILQCLPIFSMALSCQMQFFEVLESVPNVTIDRMNKIVKQATWICTMVYIFVGFFGYIAFCNEELGGNVLVKFSPSIFSDATKLGFVLSVAFSFPLAIFPCRASIYSLLYSNGHYDSSSYIPEYRFKGITIFIILLSLILALLIPSIELVIGIVGSTIGVAICVMFPASCFIKISKKDSTEKLLAQFILVGGFCLMILGTYANLSAIDEKRSGSVIEIAKTNNNEIELNTNRHELKSTVYNSIPQNLKRNQDSFGSKIQSDDLSSKNEKKVFNQPNLVVEEVSKLNIQKIHSSTSKTDNVKKLLLDAIKDIDVLKENRTRISNSYINENLNNHISDIKKVAEISNINNNKIEKDKLKTFHQTSRINNETNKSIVEKHASTEISREIKKVLKSDSPVPLPILLADSKKVDKSNILNSKQEKKLTEKDNDTIINSLTNSSKNSSKIEPIYSNISITSEKNLVPSNLKIEEINQEMPEKENDEIKGRFKRNSSKVSLLEEDLFVNSSHTQNAEDLKSIARDLKSIDENG